MEAELGRTCNSESTSHVISSHANLLGIICLKPINWSTDMPLCQLVLQHIYVSHTTFLATISIHHKLQKNPKKKKIPNHWTQPHPPPLSTQFGHHQHQLLQPLDSPLTVDQNLAKLAYNHRLQSLQNTQNPWTSATQPTAVNYFICRRSPLEESLTISD